MKTIRGGNDNNELIKAVEHIHTHSSVVALTGAGISVGSGIPDFRSRGGLWSIYSPNEYATLSVFRYQPQKAWELYRAMGRILEGKLPNSAHYALAELEQSNVLSGVVTQNVDRLHHTAGNSHVLEIHGDHHHLHCIECGHLEPIDDNHLTGSIVPHCEHCGFPLKPNVVLFEESVRMLPEIHSLVEACDVLLVIGTSAQVYPASQLPQMVKDKGGLIYEFNLEGTVLSHGQGSIAPLTDFLVLGDVESTLPNFSRALLERMT